MTAPAPVPLSQLQREFSLCLAKLILHIYDSGYACTIAEGYIADSIDKPGEDTPHRRDGGHFKRIAMDLNVFQGEKWISDGSHPIWSQLGRFWKALHPNARWTASDANHFGFLHKGVF